QELAQSLAAAPAQHQLGAVLEDHSILIVKPRLQLADAVDVDDPRAMNASKLLRIELSFQAADRLTQQVRLLSDVQAHVLAFGLDPVNLSPLQKKRPPAGFDQESLDVIGPRLQLF